MPRFLRDDLTGRLAGLGPDDLVFPFQSGTPLRVQISRRRQLDRAAAAAGLEGLTLDRYGRLFGDELDALADRTDAARADWLRTKR